MQPAEAGNDLFPWPLMQMVGVGKKDLCADRSEVCRRDPSYGAKGRHGHEGGGGNPSVGGCEGAGSGLSLGVLYSQ